MSYSEKTKSLRFLRTNWGGSNQEGGLGVRNILHYGCIIHSEPQKIKFKN